MNTVKTLEMQSSSSDATERIGEALGKQLKGGEVIELVSDLGGGKTTFVRGLARGIQSTDHVSSPTFTVSKVYKGEKVLVHHFDFYRLPEAGIMEREVAELLDDPANVIVAEWADVVHDVLPSERVTIRLSVTSENERKITIVLPEKYDYLTTGLEQAL